MRISLLKKRIGTPALGEEEASTELCPVRPRRRGATAMEYVVMLSFILMLLIAAVQQLGSVTQGLFNSAVTATSDNNNNNNGP
jgi:Flp pilus assembly pilin Flp